MQRFRILLLKKMKNFRVLTVAVSVLLMLMMAQSVAAQGKRISRMEYGNQYVDMSYDDQERVITAYDNKFGMQHFTYEEDRAYTEWLITTALPMYDDGRLAGVEESGSKYVFEWTDDVISHSQEYDSSGLDDDCVLTYYDTECNVPALSHALCIMAAIFADPEDLSIVYGCYALKDYAGIPVRKLVKTSHLQDDMFDEWERSTYDVTYDYVFDAEGYVTEVKMHIEEEWWDVMNGGDSKKYVRDKSIRIYWEPTTGVEGIADNHKVDKAIYALSGQKVARTSADALKRGAYILGGRKIIVR